MEISGRKGSKVDDWLGSVGEARRKRKANDEEISFLLLPLLPLLPLLLVLVLVVVVVVVVVVFLFLAVN